MLAAYETIIYMPHHSSLKRGRMAADKRAAQFAPFAALSGYEEAVRETERLTDGRVTLDESEQAAINCKTALALAMADSRPVVNITYFVPDPVKEGGEYVTVSGVILRFDGYSRELALEGGQRIPADNIVAITGNIFER